MTNHLSKRGSRYYFRRKIPLDLQAHFQGSKEIVKALGTSDPAEARKLVREESVRYDREFDSLRKRAASGQLTGEALKEYERQRDEYERDYQEWFDTEGRPDPLEVQFAEHDRQVAREAKRKEKHARQVAAYEEALARIMAQGGALPALPVSATPVTPALQSAPSGSSGHLAALVEQWANERKPDTRTVAIANRIILRFYEHVGRIPVASISRAHVIDFKNKLLESGQSSVNTDKHLTMLRAILNFAVDNLQAHSNAALGVKVGERKNARAARLPFDLPALQAIFASPVYAGDDRPDGGAGEASYWLPLLALFTGARVEELAQLRPEDIYEETYRNTDDSEKRCWVLRITNEGDGQGVKNIGSVRRFPIHGVLLARGFVEYAQAQRGKARIFSELKPDTMGAESGNWSKWFGKYLRRVCKVTDPKMVFHSFRHGFKDMCREAGISDEVSDALSGHASGKVSRRYGGLSYPLAPLVEAVSRIRVSGLKLP
ncbi:MAG: DUF6538 domain-containing protein [Paraburkholderia sp.]|uniref:DUF6538 domain-containing protein n=1 Tax=Paraburkholderia sp. TaxID=1926495 RepID=UPI003C4E761D